MPVLHYWSGTQQESRNFDTASVSVSASNRAKHQTKGKLRENHVLAWKFFKVSRTETSFINSNNSNRIYCIYVGVYDELLLNLPYCICFTKDLQILVKFLFIKFYVLNINKKKLWYFITIKCQILARVVLYIIAFFFALIADTLCAKNSKH